MSNVQQVGTSGKRKVKSNGYRQIAGAKCCCATGTPPLTYDSSCFACLSAHTPSEITATFSGITLCPGYGSSCFGGRVVRQWDVNTSFCLQRCPDTSCVWFGSFPGLVDIDAYTLTNCTGDMVHITWLNVALKLSGTTWALGMAMNNNAPPYAGDSCLVSAAFAGGGSFVFGASWNFALWDCNASYTASGGTSCTGVLFSGGSATVVAGC
jgi:hypothetical protein